MRRVRRTGPRRKKTGLTQYRTHRGGSPPPERGPRSTKPGQVGQDDKASAEHCFNKHQVFSGVYSALNRQIEWIFDRGHHSENHFHSSSDRVRIRPTCRMSSPTERSSCSPHWGHVSRVSLLPSCRASASQPALCAAKARVAGLRHGLSRMLVGTPWSQALIARPLRRTSRNSAPCAAGNTKKNARFSANSIPGDHPPHYSTLIGGLSGLRDPLKQVSWKNAWQGSRLTGKGDRCPLLRTPGYPGPCYQIL